MSTRRILIIVGSVILFVYVTWLLRDMHIRKTDHEHMLVGERGVFLTMTDQPCRPGQRVHYSGRLWIISKVALQNAEPWVRKNRSYYNARPGPRIENNNGVTIETYGHHEPGLRYALFGIAID